MVAGLVKIIYSHGEFNREEVEEILR